MRVLLFIVMVGSVMQAMNKEKEEIKKKIVELTVSRCSTTSDQAKNLIMSSQIVKGGLITAMITPEGIFLFNKEITKSSYSYKYSAILNTGDTIFFGTENGGLAQIDLNERKKKRVCLKLSKNVGGYVKKLIWSQSGETLGVQYEKEVSIKRKEGKRIKHILGAALFYRSTCELFKVNVEHSLKNICFYGTPCGVYLKTQGIGLYSLQENRIKNKAKITQFWYLEQGKNGVEIAQNTSLASRVLIPKKDRNRKVFKKKEKTRCPSSDKINRKKKKPLKKKSKSRKRGA